MVIAAGCAFVLLDHGGTAKFAAPDDEGVFEHASLLEVAHECGSGLIAMARANIHVALKVVVVVPSAVVKLDEAYASLSQSPCEQAVEPEAAISPFDSVGIENMLGLVRYVDEIWHAGLHAKSHFVLGDSGRNFIVFDGVVVEAVEGLDGFDNIALAVAVHAGWIAYVVDGVSSRLKVHALEFAG